MGVPAFFRWLSQKYPKIIVDVIEKFEEVDGVEVPTDTSQPNPNGREFDNLYLDMNGIIHPCAHPEDRPAPANEEEMMVAIFEYIDRLFAMVRPRQLLFMAIDGVAPRAKMNQQRSRRFKAIKESKEKAAKEAEIVQEMVRMGKEIPPKEDKPHFDSNTITPGTPFMAKVAQSLQYYIQERLLTDPGWKGIKVILSDASVPGEGEHKIMDYIRHQRAQPDYNPNTSHVLYGLDADLIMLALATHEPHFFILREIVTIGNENNCFICGQPGHLASECQGKAKEKGNDEDTKAAIRKPFQFLYVSVLREYLARDLAPPETTPLQFTFDLERAIDDFVFMCFFVGNDFLPHLPTLEIRENAIDMLVRIYKKLLPTLDGYLTENGEVFLGRVKLLMEEIGRLEDGILRERRRKQQRDKERRRRQREQRKRQREHLDQFIAGQMNPEEDRAKRYKRFEEDSPSKAAVQTAGREQLTTSSNEDVAALLRKQLAHPDASVPQPNAMPTEQKEEEKSDMDIPPGSEAETKSGPAVPALPAGDIQSSTAAYRAAIDAKDKPRNANDEEEVEIPDDVRLGDPGWKERYYKLKFNVELTDTEYIKKVATEYAAGLVWVLRYYYQGCSSWGWFYPFHYAPFAEDMNLIDEESPKHELGKPFKPFEQLMGVLPAESGSCLPQSCQVLMRHPQSSIIDFYPSDFALDMNGKRWAWQAVALLPFIDEDRLKEAMKDCEPQFTIEERRRNSRGHYLIYVHSSHPLAATFKSLEDDSQSSSAEGTSTAVPAEGSVEYLSVATTDTTKPAQEAEQPTDNSTADSENEELVEPLGKLVPIPPELSGGMTGFLARTENFSTPIGGTVQCPINLLPDIKNNQAYCAFYIFPHVPKGYVFPAKLLPNVTMPAPILTDTDLANRREMGISREGVGRFMRHHQRNASDPGFAGHGYGGHRGGHQGRGSYGGDYSPRGGDHQRRDNYQGGDRYEGGRGGYGGGGYGGGGGGGRYGDRYEGGRGGYGGGGYGGRDDRYGGGRDYRDDRYGGGRDYRDNRYGGGRDDRYGGGGGGRDYRDDRYGGGRDYRDDRYGGGRGGYGASPQGGGAYGGAPYQQPYNQPHGGAAYRPQGAYPQQYAQPAPYAPYTPAAPVPYNPYAAQAAAAPAYPPAAPAPAAAWPHQNQPAPAPAGGADPQAQAQALLAQLQQLVQMQNIAGLQRPPQ